MSAELLDNALVGIVMLALAGAAALRWHGRSIVRNLASPQRGASHDPETGLLASGTVLPRLDVEINRARRVGDTRVWLSARRIDPSEAQAVASLADELDEMQSGHRPGRSSICVVTSTRATDPPALPDGGWHHRCWPSDAQTAEELEQQVRSILDPGTGR